MPTCSLENPSHYFKNKQNEGVMEEGSTSHVTPAT